MGARAIALVEDHALVALGFRELVDAAPDLELAAAVDTVAALGSLGRPLDLVVLDLRLADGSTPAANVAAIHAMGAEVLIYTAGEDARLIQSAARTGALGLVRKSASPEALLAAIRRAAGGREVFGVDWAAAIDADESLADAGLSPRERETLSLYASGLTAQAVAGHLGVSRETVADHVARIRRKYASAGRPARSRVDLYRRAVEDGLLDESG
ncbi:response regulator transcription factor [Demequina pelophila]|uniref:response regulator transcription factor n=1 Tax=Demequina pelophila TaxID=1638984 RepID=UPI00078454E6|nr:LuxR C-terminal-related transcriptional regulator [Demequina pelophila]